MSRSIQSVLEKHKLPGAEQHCYNNLLLAEPIKLIGPMKDGDIDIIECGIEIGYLERMYYA